MKQIDLAMAEAVLDLSFDRGWQYPESVMELAARIVNNEATDTDVLEFWDGVYETQDKFIPEEEEEDE